MRGSADDGVLCVLAQKNTPRQRAADTRSRPESNEMAREQKARSKVYIKGVAA